MLAEKPCDTFLHGFFVQAEKAARTACRTVLFQFFQKQCYRFGTSGYTAQLLQQIFGVLIVQDL